MAANPVAILRGIVREWRHSQPKVTGKPFTMYLLQQYRKNQVTTERTCKSQEEMQHLAQTYFTYLESKRKYAEIHQEFHAKGERSVEETARMVGFKMPHDPK